MDVKGAIENKKKRVPSDEDDNSQPKRTCPSLPPPSCFEAGFVTEAERSWAELPPQIKHFLSELVHEEVKSTFESQFHSLLEALRQKIEIPGEEGITGSETEKFKLCFCNQIASTIFTNNEIKAENGGALRVAICDATNNNSIIRTGLWSSAQIEFFVLDGEFGSGGQQEEESTLSDFNKSILSPRDGKRPLIVGNDLKLTLENGVGFIKSLSITDNSSWMKSKKFRLGAKIRDEKTLAKFSTIRVAVSQPFRVMDHRGEVNKKLHPPSMEDEVWRLEGIGKDGAYHKNLSSHGIKTVGNFLKAYHEMGSTSLKKLLGNKVPKKTWMMMVDNAFECVTIPTYNQSSKANLLGNKVMGDEAFNESFQVHGEKNLGGDYAIPGTSFDEEIEYVLSFKDPPMLFPHGENSTSYEAAT